MKSIALCLFALLLQVTHATSKKVDANNTFTSLYDFKDSQVYYNDISAFTWLSHVPSNIVDFVDQSFSFENLDNLFYIGFSSAVLIHYDQSIANSFQKFGTKNNISKATALDADIFALPKNSGELFYFLGDGRVPLLTAAILSTYGYNSGNTRALNTGSQLLEMFVSVGVVVQAAKISIGRQTPNGATEDGGYFNGPTSLRKYIANRSRYDALPSGHLATSFGMMTILASNYKEYKVEIYSYGSVLMALLAYQMINNGVHWAGDYPLAMAIGYKMGKIIYEKGTQTIEKDTIKEYKSKFSYMILPTDDGLVARISYRF